MTTVINSTPGGNNESTGTGIVVGVVIALLLIALFFVYALPMMKGTSPDGGSIDVNVKLPEGATPPAAGTPPASPTPNPTTY